MGALQRIAGGPVPVAVTTDIAIAPPVEVPAVRASSAGAAATFVDFNDPHILDWLRNGATSHTGIEITVDQALKNPTVFRCVDLVCGNIAKLPLNIHRELDNGDTEKAKDEPVYRLLRRRPNDYQTPFEFKWLMQFRALTEDNGAIAFIARDHKRKPIALWPLDPSEIEVDLTDTYQPVYTRTTKQGRKRLDPRDVLHIRGMTRDGLHGISRVRQAAEAIGIATAAERATANMYRNGAFATGALKIPQGLSDAAYERLASQWQERHSGVGNAGTTPILEDGVDYVPLAINARDAQSAENRTIQVAEILRFFGVPRSLAMMDDTSWGSGIAELTAGFVKFALNDWFTVWEEAIEGSLLDHDVDLKAEFNPDALLKGTTKEQAEVFAMASGAGGHKPWMTPNEIRKLQNMPALPDGDSLVAAGQPNPPADDDNAAAPSDRETD